MGMDGRGAGPKSATPPTNGARSRRDVLQGLGSLALAAACAEAGPAGQSADAGAGDAASTPEVAAPKADATQAADVATAADTAPPVDLTAPADTGPARTDARAAPDAPEPEDAVAEDVAAPVAPAPRTPITSNVDHYITSCCPAPAIDAKTWSIAIVDRGQPLGKLDFALLEGLAAQTKEHTLACISAGPAWQGIGNAVWTGLPLTDILTKAGIGVPKDAPYLKLSAADGYTTGLPASDLAKPVWLVWKMNGAPIPLDHGYPARLLVPGRFGMKNPKWITALEFVNAPFVGFWEEQGWSDPAPYHPIAFIRLPEDYAAVKPNAAKVIRVEGCAYAGSDPVVGVDVRIDGGAWQAALLDYQKGADVWVLWHFDWQPAADLKQGDHTLQARCVTQSGAVSKDTAKATKWSDGFDGSMKVTVTVG